MATEHIPQIDKLIKDFGKRFSEDVKQVNKSIEQLRNGLNQLSESEDKTMHHNVTIIKEENKVIEEYWVMRAEKWGDSSLPVCLVTKRKELTHEPTLQEIAQFLSETQADFVSVEHNYRFADLPFC